MFREAHSRPPLPVEPLVSNFGESHDPISFGKETLTRGIKAAAGGSITTVVVIAVDQRLQMLTLTLDGQTGNEHHGTVVRVKRMYRRWERGHYSRFTVPLTAGEARTMPTKARAKHE
jgi:hypothetical protein